MALFLTLVLAGAAQAQQPAEQPAAAPGPVVIPRDTPVYLMVLNEVSTKNATVGQRFQLIVREPVIVGQTIVIAENARAWGEVTAATEAGAAGKSGKLSARLLHVVTPHGPVALTGTPTNSGPGGATQTVLGVLGLGPFGLFARGTNAKLKAGEYFTGYVTADTPLPR
jgi:hypothetical protein